MENVFITGRGILSPLGYGVAANEVGLRSGQSGIVHCEEFAEHHLDSTVAGKPVDFPIPDLIDRKKLRFCPPVGIMSVAAVLEMFKEAGLSVEEVRGKRIAIIGGVASSNALEIYNDADKFVSSDYRLRVISPYAVPRIMPSSAISCLSLIFGLTGESYDISAACASSALAVVVGTRLIRSGQYDMVIAGGAEQIDWTEALGFCACRALSKKYNDEPARASRPFDRDRDGFVLAGGAAYVLLESEKSLKKRGARPICRVSGLGANSNALDMVVPDAPATAGVMNEALADAGLKAQDIAYINTHGTGTTVGDPIELEGIKTIFGSKVAINSTKSQTGHMVGATGAAEVIFTSIMMEKKFISESINLENPDPEFGWADLVREQRDGVEIKHALTNSFAFGGSNAAVVLSQA